MKELDKDAKYLGNNIFLNTKRKEDYDAIKRKNFNRLEGWKTKLLSQIGRNVLVKHVVTSIPIYSMAAGKITIGWCDEVEKLAPNFLWK